MVHSLTGIHTPESSQSYKTQNKLAPHSPSLSKFLANFEQKAPATLHNNIGDFLVNSPHQFHQQASISAQTNATLQNYRFQPEQEKGSKNTQLSNSSTELKAKSLLTPNPISAQSLTPMQISKASEINNQNIPQPRIMVQNHKGYGSKIAQEPLLIIVQSPVSCLEKTSPLINTIRPVMQQNEDSTQDNNTNTFSKKNKSIDSSKISKNLPLSTTQKSEELEVLKKITLEFQKQLKAVHPSISIPIEHPEGMVDIKLLFHGKNIKALFSGSTTEIVQLLAQHRTDFIKTIETEGYNINERDLAFMKHHDDTVMRT